MYDNVILLHKRDLPYHLISHEESVTLEWIKLVRRGQERAKLPLDEELESYLVFTLMRLVRRTNLFSHSLATRYSDAQNSTSDRAREIQLSDIADICLIYAGLFPERYKHLGIGSCYFRDIGCAVLDDLATSFSRKKKMGYARLYTRVRDAFPFLTEVLLATREDADYLESCSLLKV